jgi:hypothetical protein
MRNVIARPQSSPWVRRLPACAAALVCCGASAVAAQARQRATSAAPLLREPGGIRLGRLVAGAEYPTRRVTGTWIETAVQGWIWSASTQPTGRDGFDLSVSAGGGEVVRAEPRGAIVARLEEGTLLRRLGGQGQWTRVERLGWVTRGALTVAPATPPSQPVAAPRSDPPPRPSDPPGRPASADTGRSDAPPARSAVPPPATGSERVTIRKGAQVTAAPDGEPVAVLARPGEGDVVERSGNWVKVRVEGWLRSADLTASAETGPRITGAMVRADPGRYVGQPVAWRLHFLALQVADDLRPEMKRGQPYLLARGPLPESGFVYLILSPEQAAEARALAPLDEIRIEGVIRAGRTKYLPTPVVELVSLVRS